MSDLSSPQTRTREGLSERRPIKCVVWDLDNTIWDGTLIEGDIVRLHENVVEIIHRLDKRGILQSVASRSQAEPALAKVREFGLEPYFLYPQIGWGSKVDSLRRLAKTLNVGTESMCLIDDDSFERGQVESALPEVLCVAGNSLNELLEKAEFNPGVITPESSLRRQAYLSEIERSQLEESFAGSHDEFLATLQMVFSIFRAKPDDLNRAEELTNRTNQLNTTGYTFSVSELEQFRRSPRHLLLMAELEDRLGSYGKVGLALVECDPKVWTIRLFLMSCRVMNRGVGIVMLGYILREAKRAGVRLLSEFIPNDRNRVMYVTYRLAGFKELHREVRARILEHELTILPDVPAHVSLKTEPSLF